MIHFLCLFMTLSIDIFLATFSYGANHILISKKRNGIIAIICSLFLILSLFLGETISHMIPDGMISKISFVIFILLGIWKLLTSISNWQKKRKGIKKVVFFYHGMKLVFHITNDYSLADSDHSKDISTVEALLLAIALSIDNLMAGIAFATFCLHPLFLFLLCSVLHFLILECGYFIGKKVSHSVHMDLSWLTALLFFILAFFR